MKMQWKFAAVLCLTIALAFAVFGSNCGRSGSATLSAASVMRLKSLQATHDAFLQSIAGLSGKAVEVQARSRPLVHSGSLRTHRGVGVDNLGLVQSKFMGGPATPEKRSEVKVTDERSCENSRPQSQGAGS